MRRPLDGWLTVKQIAEKLRFTETAPRDPQKACRDWLRREGLVGVNRGRVLLFDELDIDAVLRRRSA